MAEFTRWARERLAEPAAGAQATPLQALVDGMAKAFASPWSRRRATNYPLDPAIKRRLRHVYTTETEGAYQDMVTHLETSPEVIEALREGSNYIITITIQPEVVLGKPAKARPNIEEER